MISWQAKLLNNIIQLIAKSNKLSTPFDIIKYRNNIERIAKFMSYPKNINVEQFNIRHVSVDWLTYLGFKNKVILYLHGGAFVIGSTNTHRMIMSKIAELTSFSVLGINYRLAPEYPFPSGLEDAILTYEWLLQQGFNSKNIILAGDSSGGNLAIATSLLLRDRMVPLPAAITCLSPWVDLTLSGQSFSTNARNDPLLKKEMGQLAVKSYLQDQSPKLPLASPLYANLVGLPPLYIQVSEAEILYSDAIQLEKCARQAGVDINLKIYSEMMHGWQLAHAWVPEARDALIDLAQFILKIDVKLNH